MLTLPPSVRIHACTEPQDMRKTFNGLSAAVRTVLREDPLSGHLFVFFNRRRDQVRCLYWDRDGYVLIGKRLCKGRFRVPWEGRDPRQMKWTLESGELGLILEGFDLRGAKRRARWRPGASTSGTMKAI